MFVSYVLTGIVSGIVTATLTYLAGWGLLLALAAYAIGGMLGVGAGVLWSLSPQRTTSTAKQPLTQRS